MKKIFFLVGFSSFVGFCQNNTLPLNLKAYQLEKEITFKPFVWKSLGKNNNYYLTSYNSVLGINNRFTKVGDTYYLSNTKTLSTLNSIDLNRIDSFNPNGTTNFGAALLIGTLNLIFKND